MNYTLTPATFTVSSAMRDVTAYIYSSKDEAHVLRVDDAGEAPDARALLDAALATFESFYGPAIIFRNRLTLRRTDGIDTPCVEGELKSPTDGTMKRFGITALVQRARGASLLYLADRSGFMPAFRGIVSSVQFVGTSARPMMASTPGHTRHQAYMLSVEMPREWSAPTTLLFEHSTKEDVTIRVTTSDPPLKRGALSLGDELTIGRGDVVRVLSEVITDGRLDAPSWSGDWIVDRATRGRSETLRMLKSCWTFSPAETVTMHGRSSEAHAPQLHAEYQQVHSSLSRAVAR